MPSAILDIIDEKMEAAYWRFSEYASTDERIVYQTRVPSQAAIFIEGFSDDNDRGTIRLMDLWENGNIQELVRFDTWEDEYSQDSTEDLVDKMIETAYEYFDDGMFD